ncbi:MAG: hypothetical protein HYZ26_10545 [Chloroflexi bacterium]|nr:hypothetical protein [Chloroflexota bacterium]
MSKSLKTLLSLGLVALVVLVAVMAPVNARTALAVDYYEDEPPPDAGTQGRNRAILWHYHLTDPAGKCKTENDCGLWFTVGYGPDPDGVEDVVKVGSKGNTIVVCREYTGGGSLFVANGWGQRLAGNWVEYPTFEHEDGTTCATITGINGDFFVAYVP